MYLASTTAASFEGESAEAAVGLSVLPASGAGEIGA
jgi:hypothetical protein